MFILDTNIPHMNSKKKKMKKEKSLVLRPALWRQWRDGKAENLIKYSNPRHGKLSPTEGILSFMYIFANFRLHIEDFLQFFSNSIHLCLQGKMMTRLAQSVAPGAKEASAPGLYISSNKVRLSGQKDSPLTVEEHIQIVGHIWAEWD